MKNLTMAALAIGLVASTTSTNAATLVSTALQKSDIDPVGTGGIFNATTTGGTVGTVTTTLTSVPTISSNNLPNGTTGTYTFTAVDAANGLDVTYTVDVTGYFRDVSAGTNTIQQVRVNGGSATIRTNLQNNNRDSITPYVDGAGFPGTAVDGDYEFLRLEITSVVSSGATPYQADGFITIRNHNNNTLQAQDVNNGNAVLGTTAPGNPSGNNTDQVVLNLSSASTAIDLVAIDNDDIERQRDNRVQGFAVQFSVVPEPSSLALLGMASTLMLRRRR
ncbi:MAG: PEP-CTERM sorting domain-containing protein [Firmicutes bacterium]|nr:PEP-CTERM sorting domain-containing protein [Bacillota bacterium]